LAARKEKSDDKKRSSVSLALDEWRCHMLKRLILCGLTAAFMLGLNVAAGAAVGNPSLGAAAGEVSTVTPVRWVCGPYRCAWIANYPGVVVVHPYMRPWGPPPSPHCNYVRGRHGRWVLVCP
jgi:hypothetical protein